ncbi:MAG: hypothetical protein WD273_05525 [Trueperaceae bacterium]
MPRHNRAVSFERQLAEGLHYNLDVLCRLLVTPSYRNTMHATNVFLGANPNLVEPGGKVLHNGRLVNAVRLRRGERSAVAHWEQLTARQQEELEAEARLLVGKLPQVRKKSVAVPARVNRSVRITDSDFDNLLRRARRSHTKILPASADNELRERYLRALISSIQEEEFQPKWRRKAFGEAVRGWPQRLQSYFWPTPRVGYSETAEIWSRIHRFCPAIE